MIKSGTDFEEFNDLDVITEASQEEFNEVKANKDS